MDETKDRVCGHHFCFQFSRCWYRCSTMRGLLQVRHSFFFIFGFFFHFQLGSLVYLSISWLFTVHQFVQVLLGFYPNYVVYNFPCNQNLYFPCVKTYFPFFRFASANDKKFFIYFMDLFLLLCHIALHNLFSFQRRTKDLPCWR